MATAYQTYVPQGQGQQPTQTIQVKPSISKWWWISFLITSLITFAVGGGLLGVGMASYDGSSGSETTYGDMISGGFACLGIGAFFNILFWIFWAIWFRRHRRNHRQQQQHTIVYLDAAGQPYATVTTPQTFPQSPTNYPPTQYPATTKYPAVNYPPANAVSPQAATPQAVTPQPIRYTGAELGSIAPQPTELALQEPPHITSIELAAQQRAEMAASPVPLYTQRSNERTTGMEKRSGYDAAEEMRRPREEGQKNVQGPEHPDTLSSMHRPVPVTPLPASPAKIAEIDTAIAATDGLVSGIDSVIQADFDYISGSWGSEEILVLDKAAISELLYKVLQDDQTAGFRSRDFVTHEGDNQRPPYVQVVSSGGTFRPYRIAKRQDGRLVLYGHAALYRAKRALDRAKNPSATPSGADLITELIDIGHAEGALLGPRGSALWGHVRSIGSALNHAGGKKLMLQAHEAVRDKLGAIRARELEVAWGGVGDWLG
ncbi:hypothetical protein N7509_002765 [Penicillium cosmopolitanum]|uniref:Uncharacterized protein n=1 Tax=Penicillium cosmopolitanum TaxID=1131564 RepID=A0A9X0BDL9_9EURO|nr:uncharacterized protein N7509_002765 [Penicillium cosmopolitanum]KAJ5408882.1 hypothetical protein N7509_002765 [Penicillium cosmopolitanum]